MLYICVVIFDAMGNLKIFLVFERAKQDLKENNIEVLVSIRKPDEELGHLYRSSIPLQPSPQNHHKWPMDIILGAYQVPTTSPPGISRSGQRRGNRRRRTRERKPAAPISCPAGGHHHHRHDQHPRAGNPP
jgi:hypothetical protein